MKFLSSRSLLMSGAALALMSTAQAQTVTRLAMKDRIPVGTQVQLAVEFQPSGNNWCGLNIDWGNGDRRDIRLGDDEFKSSPAILRYAYSNPGNYVIVAKGTFLRRGLKSAGECTVSARALQVTAVDEVAEQRSREVEQRAREAEQRAREAAQREREATERQREAEARQRDLAQRELELKRKELEMREEALRREEQARRAAAAAPAAAPAPAPAPRPAPAPAATPRPPAKPAEGF